MKLIYLIPLTMLTAGSALAASARAKTKPHTAAVPAEPAAKFAPPVMEAAPPGKDLTLEESVKIAIRESTSVLKAQRDEELSGTQLLQGYLQFLPNLTAQAGYNKSKGITFYSTAAPILVNGASRGANYSVSTQFNLFNGLADLASWQAADERQYAAEKTLVRAKQQISLDISQSFLQTVLDQALIRIAEKNLKASMDRETLLEEQTVVGLRNKSDLFRQQAQTSADESFLITEQNNFKNDLILLLRKLRRDPREIYNIVEPDSVRNANAYKGVFKAPDETTAVDRGLEHRVDYDASRLAAAAAHQDVTTFRSTFMPRLDFSASYLASSRTFDYQNVNGVDALNGATFPSDATQLREQGSSIYGLTLTWNIFDRWVTGLNVERAKATAYKADLDAEDYRRTVIGEVKKSLIDFRAASQQMDTSERGLIAAQKAYEVSEGRYEVGSTTYVDLAIAQSALVQAESARAQAVIGYELQKRVIDFALGQTATE